VQLPDGREAVDEVYKLTDDDGRHKGNQGDNADNEQTDNSQRADKSVHSQSLQPGRQRVEQIGQRHPGDKWKQHLAHSTTTAMSAASIVIQKRPVV